MTTFQALALAALAGFSPLQKEQEDVRRGNETLVSGDAPTALQHYDAAERKAGEHPEIDFDRGHAAFRMGKLEEAAGHFKRAAEKAPAPLASRALQNLGNTLDAQGNRQGAIDAYVDALRRDPRNEDARYDLEVLLRRKEPPKAPEQKPGDGKQPQRGSSGQQGDGKQPPPDPGDGQRQERQPQPSPAPSEGKDPGQTQEQRGEAEARAGSLTRQDAERLLDALRAREKNMPVGRDRKGRGRTDVERDW